MTEQQIVHLVADKAGTITNFDEPYWKDIDPRILNVCFDKGFLRWAAGKLIVTPLGRSSCGDGFGFKTATLHHNARLN